MFELDEKCDVCGKLMADIESGKEQCIPCEIDTENFIAERRWYEFVIDVFVFTFHFRFFDAMLAFMWSFQRLFNVGDFNKKTGRFYVSKRLYSNGQQPKLPEPPKAPPPPNQ